MLCDGRLAGHDYGDLLPDYSVLVDFLVVIR